MYWLRPFIIVSSLVAAAYWAIMAAADAAVKKSIRIAYDKINLFFVIIILICL